MVTADLMHPAEKRLMAVRMSPEPAHDVQLRPLGDGDNKSIIVTSAAQNFVEALFEDVKAADWRTRLDAMRRKRVATDGVLGLSQPMHHRMQIALFEAWCVAPGRPRLDPAKIASSGIVVRRLRDNQRDGWMKRGKTLEGWTSITLPDSDPDPVRAGAGDPANAAIRAILEARRGSSVRPAAETVHALYPAPPEVCEAVGKTLLFAVIPVSSNEVSDLPPPPIDFQTLPAGDRAAIVGHFSSYLSGRPEIPLPRADVPLDQSWNVLSPRTLQDEPQLAALGTFLQQAMIELDALGPSRASKDLLGVLREIRLPTAQDSLGRPTATIDAADFVRLAGQILIGREANPTDFRMPLRWPGVSADQGERLAKAALACLTEQYKARVGPVGKFADDNARYAVRGFIRVSCSDGCPDKLVWSMESEAFRILPWWDDEGPTTTVTLPDIATLKRAKPTVAFAMPPSIGDVLGANMKKLSDGEEQSINGPGIAWLCSFSMPYITICAFIVLNIFLSLLDIVFRWMMFIKICIPIPVPAAPPPRND